MPLAGKEEQATELKKRPAVLEASLFTKVVDWLAAMRAILRHAPEELTSWWVATPAGEVLLEIVNDKEEHWCSKIAKEEGNLRVKCLERLGLARECLRPEGCSFRCEQGGIISAVPILVGETPVAHMGLCLSLAESDLTVEQKASLETLLTEARQMPSLEVVGDPAAQVQLKRAMRLFSSLSRVVSGSRMEASLEYLSVLAETAQLVVSSLDLSEVLGTIVRRSRALLDVDNLALYLFNRGQQALELAASATTDADLSEPSIVAVSRGITGKCYQSGVPFGASDIEESSNLDDVEVPKGVKSFLAVPMLDYGEVRGVVVAYARERQDWDEGETRYLQALGSLVIVASRSYQLNSAVRRRISELETLHKVSRSIASTLDLRRVLELVSEASVRALNASGALLYMYDEASGKLSPEAAFGVGEHFLSARQLDPAAERVAITHDPLMEREADKHPEHGQVYRGLAKSILSVPLTVKNEFLGTLTVYDRLGENGVVAPFEEDDLRLLLTFAGQAAIAIENARLFTNVQRAQEAARKAELELAEAEKLAALGAITASLAHEIRNPMAAIGGLARRLVKLLPADDTHRRYAETIQQEASRLLDLLSSTLDFARGPKPNYELVRPERFLLEPLDLVEELFASRDIKVKRELAPNLPELRADVNGLKQAFLNLYQNAAEAMPEGGTLTVTARASNSRLQVKVRDTGQGIDEELLPKIFQPFVTSKQSGTGLGLALVSHLIRQHGGKLDVSSEVGKGTEFRISLPIRLDIEPAFATEKG